VVFEPIGFNWPIGIALVTVLSTLAALKRETGGWSMPLLMAGYLFALAYAASFITYRIALSCGGG
jgi:ferrous iron transport protein B